MTARPLRASRMATSFPSKDRGSDGFSGGEATVKAKLEHLGFEGDLVSTHPMTAQGYLAIRHGFAMS